MKNIKIILLLLASTTFSSEAFKLKFLEKPAELADEE